MDKGAWRATVHGVTKESDMTYQFKKKKKKAWYKEVRENFA